MPSVFRGSPIDDQAGLQGYPPDGELMARERRRQQLFCYEQLAAIPGGPSGRSPATSTEIAF